VTVVARCPRDGADPPALLLDYNGTLADDEALQAQVWIDTFAAYGISYSTDTYFAHHVGLADPDVVAAALDDAASTREPEVAAALISDRRRRYIEAVRRAPPVTRGSVELLRRLDEEGVPWCIVSGAARAEIEAGLSASGIDPHPVAIVAVDDVRRPKPDSEAHRLALARLGRSAPDAWAVEDSKAGIAAARGAGLRVVGTGSSLPPSLLARLTDLVSRVDATLLDAVRAHDDERRAEPRTRGL
jgi:HAD superfamily hydrolase (TIGR01509 family)